jgi:penicillin-binding protein 1C
LFDAFARTGELAAPLARAPAGVIFAASAKLPPPLQRFGASTTAGAGGSLRILFPPDGARLERASESGRSQPVPVKVSGGTEPLTVIVNGNPLAPIRDRRRIFIPMDEAGFVRVTVIDLTGKADSVLVRVQ